MNKVWLFVGLFIMSVTICSSSVQAHVLVADDSGRIGAVLHISPDDDPVAGEPSTLVFDIQSQSFSKHTHVVSMIIADENGAGKPVPVTFNHSSVSATYTFPARGVYRISLTAAAASTDVQTAHAHTFTHMQRVSRGVAGGALDKPTHAWAEATLVLATCSFLVIAVIGFNRRREVASYSYSKW